MSGLMDGKVCIVTGATSGIGQITALELAKMGASVVAVGRNAQKGAATLEMIKRQSASETVEFLQADLSSQQSIRQLVQAYGDNMIACMFSSTMLGPSMASVKRAPMGLR